MREPDLAAIELAGGLDASVCIIPTAAAPDNNHVRAGKNGIRWFKSMGVRNVSAVSLIDQQSANDPAVADALRTAKLIYMLGGFTHYLAQTLLGSKAWLAVLDAYQNGAVVAGSSAGAMVMCEHYYDPKSGKVMPGLNLVPNSCVLPHHNTFGKNWAEKLKRLLPGVSLVGIDEYTGVLTNDTEWQVLGAGAVTIYRNNTIQRYENGQKLFLAE